MSDSEYPQNLRYTAEHEWIDDSSPAVIGITSHAAEALGDVVYLDLPEVGREVRIGEVVGEIESSKSVSELYSPVSGTVREVNQAAVDDPAAVNRAPYSDGWLIKVDVVEAGELLSAEEYAAML